MGRQDEALGAALEFGARNEQRLKGAKRSSKAATQTAQLAGTEGDRSVPADLISYSYLGRQWGYPTISCGVESARGSRLPTRQSWSAQGPR